MAARDFLDIKAEVSGILKKQRISVHSGEAAGKAGGETDEASQTIQTAVLRLLAIQIELLMDIREGRVNPP